MSFPEHGLPTAPDSRKSLRRQMLREQLILVRCRGTICVIDLSPAHRSLNERTDVLRHPAEWLCSPRLAFASFGKSSAGNWCEFDEHETRIATS